MADPIEDYIRANRAGHPREALTEQLVAAGHDRAAVEAAWKRLSIPAGEEEPAPLLGQSSNQAGVIVRSYRAKSQAEAAKLFQADAAQMAMAGYYPVSQSWAPGQWGCGAFLVALLLALVLIGFLIFIYLLIVKPDGTLTVTYQYRPPLV
jgi:hypothetical protein